MFPASIFLCLEFRTPKNDGSTTSFWIPFQLSSVFSVYHRYHRDSVHLTEVRPTDSEPLSNYSRLFVYVIPQAGFHLRAHFFPFFFSFIFFKRFKKREGIFGQEP